MCLLCQWRREKTLECQSESGFDPINCIQSEPPSGLLQVFCWPPSPVSWLQILLLVDFSFLEDWFLLIRSNAQWFIHPLSCIEVWHNTDASKDWSSRYSCIYNQFRLNHTSTVIQMQIKCWKRGEGNTLRLTLHILYLNYFYCQYICHRNKAGTVATHHFSWKQQNWWCSKMWLLFTESSWIMLFLLSSFFKLLTALFLHCILNFCSRLFKFRRWDVDDGSQSSRSRLFKVLYRWQLDLIQLLEEDVSPLIQVSTSVLATASVLSILGLQSHILNSIIGVHICQRCYIHW